MTFQSADVEKIVEEFIELYGPDTDQMVSAHQSYMPQEVADWWVSKISSLSDAAYQRGREEAIEQARNEIERRTSGGFSVGDDSLMSKTEVLAALDALRTPTEADNK